MHNSTFFRSHEARQQIIVAGGNTLPLKLYNFVSEIKSWDLFRAKHKISAQDLKWNHISVNYITVFRAF